ncbi:MAG: hypothetical protein RLZZ138_30 [Actinomycetota bacterium]
MADPAAENRLISERLVQEFREFLTLPHVILGPAVSEFEGNLKVLTGSDFALGVANGTDALVIALRALQLAPGSAVAMMPNAGGYALNAVLANSLTPVWVDCGESGQIDSEILEAQISDWMSTGTSVQAAIITHLWGAHGDVERCAALLKSNGIRVIEDCAQAIGLKVGGKHVGSFGEISTFSFYPSKNLGALGDGGGITTSDPGLHELMLRLRQYGWGEKYVVQDQPGINSRLDEIQARFLSVKIGLLHEFTERRVRILNNYVEAISAPNSFLSALSKSFTGHLAVMDTSRVSLERSDVQRLASESGIETAIHYPLLDYQQPFLKNSTSRAQPYCPNAERLQARILSVPIHSAMSEVAVGKVCSFLEKLS